MNRLITEQAINSFDFIFDLRRAGQVTTDAGQRQLCTIDKCNGGIQRSILSVFVKRC